MLPAPAGYGRSQLIASGVCGTDLHITRGTLAVGAPSIIGHEFVGRLDDCDPAEAAKYGLRIGDNVIADIAVPCGECLLCRSGDDANCVNMQVTNEGSVDVPPYLYGGYAEVNFTPLTPAPVPPRSTRSASARRLGLSPTPRLPPWCRAWALWAASRSCICACWASNASTP